MSRNSLSLSLVSACAMMGFFAALGVVEFSVPGQRVSDIEARRVFGASPSALATHYLVATSTVGYHDKSIAETTPVCTGATFGSCGMPNGCTSTTDAIYSTNGTRCSVTDTSCDSKQCMGETITCGLAHTDSCD